MRGGETTQHEQTFLGTAVIRGAAYGQSPPQSPVIDVDPSSVKVEDNAKKAHGQDAADTMLQDYTTIEHVSISYGASVFEYSGVAASASPFEQLARRFDRRHAVALESIVDLKQRFDRMNNTFHANICIFFDKTTPQTKTITNAMSWDIFAD